MNKLFKIDENDNVAVALEPLKKGDCVNGITLLDDIPFGHKVLLCDLKKGDKIIKYSNPIGSLICDAKKGSYIHCHNLKTNLNEGAKYCYNGCKAKAFNVEQAYFNGYVRPDGKVGTRNEIWIIPTVGCVNNTVRRIERLAEKMDFSLCDGVFAFTHPYGCSQMEEDQENTRRLLASLINHSNAGAVLVVSLGCENTNAQIIKDYLGDYDSNRVKFLVTQNCTDELEEAKTLLTELYDYAKQFKRERVSADNLTVGFKCGGSDAFSGITANALCGRLTDLLSGWGASAILTEVPEMFGAEQLLMNRAENEKVFNDIVKLISSYKDYFESNNQVCYENPSPGNHDGGITTLEEKSLGCVQKGGSCAVCDVLQYASAVKKKGLSLLWGPGNDIVSTTNLTAAGANIILFTTGRGTPLGAPVPTVKISSNSSLAQRKSNWIDFDAGGVINGGMENALVMLKKLVLEVASGKPTENEINGYREIAIFKSGVTM